MARLVKMTVLISALLSLSLSLSGCGAISLGDSSGAPNDAVPSGTVVIQGTFSGQSGQTVTGAAIIYSMGATSYIVRLSGITAPSESGLQVQVWANGSTPVYSASLRSSAGNQNYNFSNSSRDFSQVCIYSTQKVVNYGCALLQ